MKDKSPWDGCAPAKIAGDRHVDARWHHIREFVKRERGLVAVYGLRFLLASAVTPKAANRGHFKTGQGRVSPGLGY